MPKTDESRTINPSILFRKMVDKHQSKNQNNQQTSMEVLASGKRQRRAGRRAGDNWFQTNLEEHPAHVSLPLTAHWKQSPKNTDS